MMRISVVTPSYNQARFLPQCLESVRMQSGDAVEHVVHDGNSSDGSIDVLRQWQGHVRWVSRRDRGQADAVNQGIRGSGGEVIGWLNSDDFYYPGAFDAVLRAFGEDCNLDVVYGAADYVDINGRAYQRYPTEPWSYERLIEVCFVCQPALFFRRRVTTRLGLLDENLHFCLDYEYWLRFAHAGVRVRYLSQTLAASRMYPTNKTMGSSVAAHAEINGMMRARFGATPDNWLFSYGHALAATRISRARFPQMYGAFMAITSVLAALRWNRRIRITMLRRIGTLVRKRLLPTR